jgi:8-oxo-dGTP diphosphatase
LPTIPTPKRQKMKERRSAFEAVLIIILKDKEVLLHKRKNTGWMDGWYDVPSGHVEPGEPILEAACREVMEETRLNIAEEDLKLIHISQADAGNGRPYTYFVFLTISWKGKPVLNEPDTAEDLNFYGLNNLPQNIPPYTRAGLESVGSRKVNFSFFGPDNF